MRDQENKSAMSKTNEKPMYRIQGTLPVREKPMEKNGQRR